MHETITTTNSKLLNNEVKHYCIELKSLAVELSSSVKLCPGFDPINVLSWSHVNVNASIACTLASRIAYDDEMTASLRGSDCLNGKNAFFNHGILTWILTLIWTIRLRIEMTILSCTVTACPSSMISSISLDVMKILGIWSTNCSLIVIDVCIYCFFWEI